MVKSCKRGYLNECNHNVMLNFVNKVTMGLIMCHAVINVNSGIYFYSKLLHYHSFVTTLIVHAIYIFLVAPLVRRSDLSTHYGVCMYVVLWKYFFTKRTFSWIPKKSSKPNFFSSNFELIFKIQIFRPFHRINGNFCYPNLKLIDAFSMEFWPF